MAATKTGVLSVTSECVPLIKSGGLADVAGALPGALAGQGITMRVLLPAYRGLLKKIGRTRTVLDLPNLFGGKGRVVAGTVGDMQVLLLDAPHLFDRAGGPYLDAEGRDFPDNPERFAALSWAAAEIAEQGLSDGWKPSLVHAHDWQAALAPVYLRLRGIPVPSILTIHNIAFQGLAPFEKMQALRLPPELWERGDTEYWGQIGVLKAGLIHADRVTTVSPTYALELRRDRFGMGLQGVIAARPDGICGLLNGIDTEVWNPETDPEVVSFSARSLAGRAKNRKRLVAEFGLTDTGGPIAAVISRLTRQKGLDLLPEVIPSFLARGGMVAILGNGDADIQEALRSLAAHFPGKVGLYLGYDEARSHRVFAGADCIVIPSRFEPCGLTQLYGLRYGAVPMVVATGGLADTVIAANPAALDREVATGIVLPQADTDSLRAGFDQLLDLHAQPDVFRRIRRNGMAANFGWARSAQAYAELYHDLAPELGP
ncbi:MAG: glycogen synthase GlgA [Celeribacter sp.]|jgi:starch synthase